MSLMLLPVPPWNSADIYIYIWLENLWFEFIRQEQSGKKAKAFPNEYSSLSNLGEEFSKI